MKQTIVDFINVTFGFRKFIAWFGLFVVGIIFRLTNHIDGGQFVDLMKTTFMGFVAGNGIEHLMSTVKVYVGSKGQAIASAATAAVAAAGPNDNVVSE